VMVSDLDKASMYCGTVNAKPIGPDVVPEPPVSPPCDGVALHDRWWLAYLRRGVLQARRPEGSPASGQPVFSVRWLGTTVLRTQSASRGRSMELSDVVRFRHLVLAVCDITGMVWKVRVEDGSVFQRHAVAGGNGEATVPGKLEWATRKDGKLVMGSVGTRMHDEETGAFVHRDSEWVKVLGPNGGIENADWGAVFAALRSAAGVGAGGYLWHEAVEWDPLHRRWLVLPRKRSFTDPYDAELDESKGTNVLLVADEHFRNVTARTVGPVEPEWGFSALRRVPGTDGVLMVLKCREVAGVMRTVRRAPRRAAPRAGSAATATRAVPPPLGLARPTTRRRWPSSRSTATFCWRTGRGSTSGPSSTRAQSSWEFTRFECPRAAHSQNTASTEPAR